MALRVPGALVRLGADEMPARGVLADAVLREDGAEFHRGLQLGVDLLGRRQEVSGDGRAREHQRHGEQGAHDGQA